MGDLATLLLLVLATVAVAGAAAVLRWYQNASDMGARRALATEELEELQAAVETALQALDRKGRALMRELDERESRLERATEHVEALAARSGGAPESLAPLNRGPEGAEPQNPMGQCWELHRQGRDNEEIATRTGLSRGEVELALRLAAAGAAAVA